MKILSKLIIGTFLIVTSNIHANAQTTSSFNGTLVNKDYGVRIHLDLDQETIEIPGMSFLGLSHGYLDGITNNHVYGVWMLIKHHIEGNKAMLRFTNDIGSDSQDITITQLNDSTFTYTATGSNSIRKVDGRKLVKIPATMTLQREAQ